MESGSDEAFIARARTKAEVGTLCGATTLPDHQLHRRPAPLQAVLRKHRHRPLAGAIDAYRNQLNWPSVSVR
jgi:hypothetical protein